jgi:hypothetical protein
MCILGAGALLGLGGAGAATAAGATAAATTTASTLSTLATIASIGGTVFSGVNAYRSGREQAAAIENQAVTERALTATQDARQRAKMSSVIRQQTAELAARGVQMDSPTAVYLGQTAAQEMSFDSQAIRSDGAARQVELSTQAKLTRANATAGLWKGVIGGASEFLTAGPDIWPNLFGERQLA